MCVRVPGRGVLGILPSVATRVGYLLLSTVDPAFRAARVPKCLGRSLVIALVDRRLARSRRFALRRSNLGIGMSHKWGTSTKVGDSFPNKAVDIGFVGLDPANRKMCARPLPRRRRRTPRRRSFARTLAAEPQLQPAPHRLARAYARPCPHRPPARGPGRAISTRARFSG